jgi:hypothetical protein
MTYLYIDMSHAMLKKLLNRVIGETHQTGAGRKRKHHRKRRGMGNPGIGYDGSGKRAGMVYSGRKPRRHKAGARAGKRNPWLSFVKKYRKKHPGMAGAELLKAAAKSYKGSGKRAGARAGARAGRKHRRKGGVQARELFGVGRRKHKRGMGKRAGNSSAIMMKLMKSLAK